MNAPRWLLVVAALLLYVLHQDFWFWRTARPVVLGLPVALVYHAGYCLAASLLLVLLVRTAWPKELEREAERREGDPS